MKDFTEDMHRIFKETVSIYRKNFQNENVFANVREINGNYHLLNLLNDIPQYKEKYEEFLESEEVIHNKRGRPRNAPDNKDFMLSLVMKLYTDNQIKYSSERSFKLCMERNLSVTVEQDVVQENKERKVYGSKVVQGYLFACNKKDKETIHWVDTFSALHKYCELFGDSNVSFSTFIANYKALMSKLNNRAIEPFYPRSINDICAVYTIYANKTSDFFKAMKKSLSACLIKAQKNITSTRELSGVIMNIIEVNKKNTDAVINDISMHIMQSPASFTIERHYGVISDILSKQLNLIGVDGTTLFKSENRISEKEKCIANFELKLYEYMAYGMTEEEQCVLGKLVLNKGFYYVANEAIFSELGNIRDTDTVSVGVIAMLRIIAIVEIISGIESGYINRTSKETADIINSMLASYGLVKLSPYCKDYCTEGNQMDWCIAAYIEEHFPASIKNEEYSYEM